MVLSVVVVQLIWWTPKENDLEHMLGEYGNKGKSLDARAQSLGHRDGTELIEVNVTSGASPPHRLLDRSVIVYVCCRYTTVTSQKIWKNAAPRLISVLV